MCYDLRRCNELRGILIFGTHVGHLHARFIKLALFILQVTLLRDLYKINKAVTDLFHLLFFVFFLFWDSDFKPQNKLIIGSRSPKVKYGGCVYYKSCLRDFVTFFFPCRVRVNVFVWTRLNMKQWDSCIILILWLSWILIWFWLALFAQWLFFKRTVFLQISTWQFRT